MADSSEKGEKPKNKFLGLKRDQQKALIEMRRQMVARGVPSERISEGLEPFRLTMAMGKALEELKTSDVPTFHRVAAIIRGAMQQELDFMNQAVASEPTAQRLDAQQLLDSPRSLAVGLHGMGANQARATLIDWLKDKDSATKVVELLKEFQALHPDEEN